MAKLNYRKNQLNTRLSDCTWITLLLGILLTFTSLAHASDFFEQNLTFNTDYNANVSIQNGLLIKVYQRQKNKESNQYNVALALNHSDKLKSYPYVTSITQLTTGKVIFEGNTPYFDKAFYDLNSRVVVLLNNVLLQSNDIWMINEKGNLVYRGQYIDSLYETEYENMYGNDNNWSVNGNGNGNGNGNWSEDNNSAISANSQNNNQPKSGIYAAPGEEFERFSKSNTSQQNTFFSEVVNIDNQNQAEVAEEAEAAEEVAEEEDLIIITSCGGRLAVLADSISTVTLDDRNNVTGFEYQQNNETYLFDIEQNESLQNEIGQSIKSELADDYPFACASGFNEQDSLEGVRYSRWCENDSGIRQGQVESWLPLEFINDSDFVSNNIDNFVTTENLVLVGEGEYQENLKQGGWSVFSPRLALYIKCQYINGVLEGQCVENDGNYTIETSYSSGDINGWLIAMDEGVLDEKCFYKQGYRNGLCVTYDRGEIYESCTYNGESLVGVCTEFANDGITIESECEMLGNQYHGLCTDYKDDGNVAGIAEYSFDEELWEQLY